jgi:hypothetical protein
MKNTKKLKPPKNIFSRKTKISTDPDKQTNKHHKTLKNGLIRLDFKVDPQLKAELREKAGREGISLSAYVSKLLEEQVERHIFMAQHIEILKPVIEKAVQDAMDRNIPVTPNVLKAIEPWLLTKPASRARN